MANQKNKIEDALRNIHFILKCWQRPNDKEILQRVISDLKEINEHPFFDSMPTTESQILCNITVLDNVCREVMHIDSEIIDKFGIWQKDEIFEISCLLGTLHAHIGYEKADLKECVRRLSMTEFEKVAFAEFSQFFKDANGKIDERKAKTCLSEMKEEIEQRGCKQLDAEQIRIIFLKYANYGTYLMLHYGDDRMCNLLSKLGVEVKAQTFNPKRVEKTKKEMSQHEV